MNGTGAQALVQGYVRANGDGTLTVGCYLYDVLAKSELARQGFVVSPGDWRRAAHKCADTIYTKLTGEGPYFDSRITYVSETGPKAHRIKRLAIMDQDGANHRFLTNGQSIVLTRASRRTSSRSSICPISTSGPRFTSMTSAPAASAWWCRMPRRHSRRASRPMAAGSCSLWRKVVTPISTACRRRGTPQRLTNAPGIDTGGSYSPDGSKIVFESDRSGGQQIYVMNADGSNQQRISFGGGRYATPVWSPRGDLIAFTKLGGAFRIGIMSPSGGGEKLLTNSWQDEGPSWSPNGRVITFQRTTPGASGKADVWMVDLTGVNERRIPTPLDGSDPAWGPLRQ